MDSNPIIASRATLRALWRLFASKYRTSEQTMYYGRCVSKMHDNCMDAMPEDYEL